VVGEDDVEDWTDRGMGMGEVVYQEPQEKDPRKPSFLLLFVKN
jgi:hypothetical protein